MKPIAGTKFGFGLKPKQEPNLQQPVAMKAKSTPLVSKAADHNKSIIKKKETLVQVKDQKEESMKKREKCKKEEMHKKIAKKKLELKQKLACIKIQKFWRARCRRRHIRIVHLKYVSAIRRIQRWYK